MSGGVKRKFLKWCDEWVLAFCGIKQVFLHRRFLIPFIIAFIFFGVLLNLLSGGSGTFNSLFIGDFGFKLKVLGSSFLAIFGVGRGFLDWAFVFLVALVQGILIGLVSVVYNYRKESANLENVGIVAGLAILGSGCPTCGTTVLAPVIVSILGTSGMAIAGTISWILTILSIVVALLMLKKMGLETYAILANERYMKKHSKERSKNGK